MSTPSHLENIGKMIKAMRKERGLTLGQLADKAALRVATISDIENGKINFEINTLARLASALNCYIDITLTPAD